MLAHRVCKQVCLVSPEPDVKGPTRAGDKGEGEEVRTITRRVKMSNILDPTDEMEFPAARATQVDEWFKKYELIKKGPPLVDVEPTVDQVSAIHTRCVVLGGDPYADFRC